MRRLAAAGVVLCALASPVAATEWLNCSDRDGAASIDLLLGAMDVAAVVGVTLSSGDDVWASHVEYGPGEPIAVGQAFETPELLAVDFMDEALANRIAELRLFKAEGADGAPVHGGTLRLVEGGAWAVSCSGP